MFKQKFYSNIVWQFIKLHSYSHSTPERIRIHLSLFKEISKQLNDLLFGILYYNCCNKFLKECINFEGKI